MENRLVLEPVMRMDRNGYETVMYRAVARPLRGVSTGLEWSQAHMIRIMRESGIIVACPYCGAESFRDDRRCGK